MSAPPDRLDAAAPAPPPRPRRRPVLRYLAAAVFTLLVALTVFPDHLFGLDQRSPWAQLGAFRWQLLVALLALCLLLAVMTIRWHAVWPFTAGGVAILLLGAALVAPRLVAGPDPSGGTPLTVLAFNVNEGRADVAAIAAEIREQQPDLVSLEEAGDRYREKITPLVEPLGYRVTTTTGRGHPDVGGVTLLVAARLGAVTHRIGSETSAFPYLEATGGALGTLRFVAFHSLAPMPGDVPRWRADVARVATWCAGPTPAIVAGDFNATLDSSVLRTAMAGCGDAAQQRGAALIPTWGPTDLLRSVGPQIDHILATTGITAARFAVLPLPGSDHRALLATLQVPASG